MICDYLVYFTAATPLDPPRLSAIGYILQGDAFYGNVRFSSFHLPFCNPQEVASSSRIFIILQALPEIVGPSKRQADLCCLLCVHWHVECLETSLGLTCRDWSCALASIVACNSAGRSCI